MSNHRPTPRCGAFAVVLCALEFTPLIGTPMQVQDTTTRLAGQAAMVMGFDQDSLVQ